MNALLSTMAHCLTALYRRFSEILIGIPYEEMAIVVDKLKLQAVPAHYLHSSDSFHLYDEAARSLFSGDIGAAILPEELSGLFLKDFDRHLRFPPAPYGVAKRPWCERVASMDIDTLYPQHGAIYQGADVERFINRFSELQVGTGLV